MNTIKVRMKRPYGAYKAGETVEAEESLALRLIAFQYATPDPQGSLLETAALEPDAERADVTPRRKGRR